MFQKIRAYLAKFHRPTEWTENTHAATLWSYEIIRNGKPLTKTTPKHNATINSGLNVARQVLHQAGHGGFAGFDRLTVGSTDYTPAATDTTLTGEVNKDGLERISGTYTNDSATGSWKLEHTFTYTGTNAVTIHTGALFNSASAGNMLYAAKFAAPATLITGVQIKITITGTIAAT